MPILMHDWHDKACFVKENPIDLQGGSGATTRRSGSAKRILGAKENYAAYVPVDNLCRPKLRSELSGVAGKAFTILPRLPFSASTVTLTMQGHGLPQPALCPVQGWLLFRAPSLPSLPDKLPQFRCHLPLTLREYSSKLLQHLAHPQPWCLELLACKCSQSWCLEP